MNPPAIAIKRYEPERKKEWDEIVRDSKNGTFLFYRDYMEYHADRFRDNSYMIYLKGKLYCLLPATRKDDILNSHAGLTYGGLVMSRECTAEGILEVFSELIDELKREGVKKFIYKPVPYIYSSLPSQEDLYALFRFNAHINYRNISTVIDKESPIKISRLRRRSLEKAEINNLEVRETFDAGEIWPVIEENLRETYGARPVHDVNEMKRLAALFPDNIKLYKVVKDSEILCAGVFYITKNVVHAQYIHANKKGKELGAVDAVVDYIVKSSSFPMRYFDFGTSNEDGGRILNEALIHTKEGFGGRGVCYDCYEINIAGE